MLVAAIVVVYDDQDRIVKRKGYHLLSVPMVHQGVLLT